MLTEKLFRAKAKDTNKWVYGYYVCLKNKSPKGENLYIIVDDTTNEFHPIQLETLGRCVGTPDKNNVMAFEGDIVQEKRTGNYATDYATGVIVYDTSWGGFTIKHTTLTSIPLFGGKTTNDNTPSVPFGAVNYKTEIIGNIFDNKDLLERNKT